MKEHYFLVSGAEKNFSKSRKILGNCTSINILIVVIDNLFIVMNEVKV